MLKITFHPSGKWGLGLWLGLEFFKAHVKRGHGLSEGISSSSGTSGTPSSVHDQNQVHQKRAPSAAEHQQVLLLQQWLLYLLLGYLGVILTPRPDLEKPARSKEHSGPSGLSSQARSGPCIEGP